MKKAILLYDDHCPLCVCYTKLFVRTGLLKPEERRAFSTVSEEFLTRIDFVRGTNEIPLINEETGQVYYGIDALLEVLGRKMPWIKTVGQWAPVHYLLGKLYKFISYNRKVIVATGCGPGEIDCSPSFHSGYRTLFLVMGLLFTTAMLFPAFGWFFQFKSFALTTNQWLGAFGAVVLLNLVLSFFFTRERAFEFLGQVTMLALIASGLMIPLLLLENFLPPLASMVGLILAGLVVLKEYGRRMNYLGLFKSYAWIAGLQLGGMVIYLLYVFGVILL